MSAAQSAVASITVVRPADHPFLGTNTEAFETLQPEALPDYQDIEAAVQVDFLAASVTGQLILAEAKVAGPWVRNEHGIGSKQTNSESAARDTVLTRLWALFLNGEADDLGINRATCHAYSTARRLVLQVASELGSEFPAGSPSLDSEGGIRITWFRGNREVELACPGPSGPSPFIYHEAGTEYDLEERAGSRALVRWLQWLTNRG